MRRAISILCTLLLIALLALFCSIRAQLPGDTSALVQEKYDAWSGVLRLWIFEGWNANATGWINRAAASFETMHAGVYMQARKVDAQALRAFSSGDINPPDMILFPPGLLDSSDGLRDLGALPALRDGLAACADGYAVPVLMGAYACAQASAPQSSAHLCPPADGYSRCV